MVLKQTHAKKRQLQNKSNKGSICHREQQKRQKLLNLSNLFPTKVYIFFCLNQIKCTFENLFYKLKYNTQWSIKIESK